LEREGPIGGDLGGYYTIFWEARPFQKNGKTIKLKGKTLMLSPANYRIQVQISIDGGPYTSFGNPWVHKVEAEPSSKQTSSRQPSSKQPSSRQPSSKQPSS